MGQLSEINHKDEEMSSKIRNNFEVLNDNRTQIGYGVKIEDLRLYNPFSKGKGQQDKKQIIEEANRSGAATAKSKNHNRLLSDSNIMGDYMDTSEMAPSLASGRSKSKAAVSTNLL